jgi:hypothetical protein
VLGAAGVAFRAGEEALRPTRLALLFHAGLPLGHFPLELLRSAPGWDEAFARTITELEASSGKGSRTNWDIRSCSASAGW